MPLSPLPRSRGRVADVRRHAPRLALAGLVALGIGCAPTEQAAPAAPELVLVSDRDGAGLDLYLHALGSDAFTRLTSDPADDYGPAWSPDGARILFENDDGGQWDVYIMNADGSERTNLSDFEGYDGGAAFSPDGSEIVFTSTREALVDGHAGRDVWLMDADGSDLRRLTTNGMYEGAPRFSPDGRRIAFCRQLPPAEEGGAANGDIFVMDRDGSNQRRLTTTPSFDCLADWSPNGERLAFHACGPEGCRLYLVGLAEGSRPVEIPTDHSANWPAWSPDGAWIAYTATVPALADDGADTGETQTDIWLVRPDGSESRPVTNRPGRDEVAAWRPSP